MIFRGDPHHARPAVNRRDLMACCPFFNPHHARRLIDAAKSRRRRSWEDLNSNVKIPERKSTKEPRPTNGSAHAVPLVGRCSLVNFRSWATRFSPPAPHPPHPLSPSIRKGGEQGNKGRGRRSTETVWVHPRLLPQ